MLAIRSTSQWICLLIDERVWAGQQTYRSPLFRALLQSDSSTAKSARETEPARIRASYPKMIDIASSFVRVISAYSRRTEKHIKSVAHSGRMCVCMRVCVCKMCANGPLTSFQELGLLLSLCLTSKWAHLILPCWLC